MHVKKPSCLNVSGFYLVLWPTDYHSRVSDGRQGAGVDCPDLVLPIQLTPQDLPYSLQIFGGCRFPSSLFMVPVCLWDYQVLVALLNVCSVATPSVLTT